MNRCSTSDWLLGLSMACALAIASCKQGDVPAPPAASHSASTAPVVAAPPISASSQPGSPQPPGGYVAVRVFRVVLAPEGGAVLLRSDGDGRILPIFIGGTEAISIGLRKETQRYSRPLTHDLLDTVVKQLGGELVKVQVERIDGNVFIGRVFFRQGQRTFDLDARPSDAVALALGNHVPIFVATAVLNEAAIRPEDLPPDDGVPTPRTGRPDEPTQL